MIHRYEIIHCHDDTNQQLHYTPRKKSNERSKSCFQRMTMRLIRQYFSNICSQKWSSQDSEQPERSEYNTKKRQHDNTDNQSNRTSTNTQFCSSHFFSSQDRDNISQNNDYDYDDSPYDEKCPRKGMCTRELK